MRGRKIQQKTVSANHYVVRWRKHFFVRVTTLFTNHPLLDSHNRALIDRVRVMPKENPRRSTAREMFLPACVCVCRSLREEKDKETVQNMLPASAIALC